MAGNKCVTYGPRIARGHLQDCKSQIAVQALLEQMLRLFSLLAPSSSCASQLIGSSQNPESAGQLSSRPHRWLQGAQFSSI